MTREELKNLALLYSLDAPAWGRYVVLDAFGDLEVYSHMPRYHIGVWTKNGNIYSSNNRYVKLKILYNIIDERKEIREKIISKNGMELQRVVSEVMEERYGISKILIEINS